jgi:membrane protein DedA with SNARE-associated domain
MTQALGQWIISNIAAFGYAGVVLLMALESANIPLPSEITLPFAGFLVSQGKLDFHLAALAGAVGCLVGSIPSYWLGRAFGRPFVERYGKWIFLGQHQLKLGDTWMTKYGDSTAFFSRLLPVVRTFISFVAGIWRAPFLTFCVLTFAGSWIWSYFLVYVGMKLGEHWEELHPYWQKGEVAIVGLILAVVVGYAWFHWKQAGKPKT